MNQYSMIVQWSDEDRLFLVTIPERERSRFYALYSWRNSY